MRIRNIRITNFRNLRALSFAPARLAILIGENGCGKSNVLHALRLIFDPSWRQLQADLSDADINSDARREGDETIEVRVEIGALESHPDLQAVFLESLSHDSEEQFVEVVGRYARADDGDFEWTTVVSPPTGSAAPARPFSPRMARMLPLLFVETIRDASRQIRFGRGTLLTRALGDVDLAAVRDGVHESLDAASAKIRQAPQLTQFISELQKLAQALLPGGTARVDLTFLGSDEQDILRALGVNLAAHRDAPPIPVERHGTGIQNLLLLAMYRYVRSADPTVFPILAVEEPEAHLHPHAQRKLVSQLKEMDAPTLVTTHSCAVADVADPRSIVRLHPSGAAATTAHQMAAGGVDREEVDDLRRVLRIAGSEALFARVVILVEGDSERMALPEFARTLGHDLDREGVSIVSADSNDFSFLLRTPDPSALRVPSVVVFDTDALEGGSGPLSAAVKSGLVSAEDAGRAKAGTQADRVALLAKQGWIPVEGNFEQATCAAGHLDAVVAEIRSQGAGAELDSHLAGQPPAPETVAAFIRQAKKRRSRISKIGVANAVAANTSVTNIPQCFRNCIERAMELASR